MNVKEYKDKKAKGLAEIVKAGGGYAYATKRFSPDDGSELDPEIESVNAERIEEEKAELLAKVSDCELVIADIEVLKVAEPKK